MRVVIAGGSGMIGRALTESLLKDGVEVEILTRDPAGAGRRVARGARPLAWQPGDDTALEDLGRALAGVDAVVNLSGIPVGPLPWTPWRRRSIFDSRVTSTRTLVDAMGRLDPGVRPRVFVCASGIDGYTGLDAEPATESSDTSRTSGFLVDVGRAWESAALGAERLGIRVVLLQTAFVLARGSGLLGLLALPVRLGLGGRYGSGNQWFSWVHLDDLVGAYRLALTDASVSGPLIAAAPEPCRQLDLAAALARVLHRPNRMWVPGWLLRLVLREESTLLLGSRRVLPTRLLGAGFTFRYPDVEDALRAALGPPNG